ncbi:hypothetical protein NXX48_24315 [Bacteroides faecis]|uniref:hypothetical protein n=1 Tax=Bacteroides faecis TaxID=674529 RepID=UPI0021665AC5|nr:hypothetical protein [Bacteroides faecis]MCS2977936.1 hypothetical protein [Bacteroides faecis]
MTCCSLWGLGNVVALTGQYTASGSAGTQDNTSFTKPFYHGGNSPTFLVENSWTPNIPMQNFHAWKLLVQVITMDTLLPSGTETETICA